MRYLPVRRNRDKSSIFAKAPHEAHFVINLSATNKPESICRIRGAKLLQTSKTCKISFTVAHKQTMKKLKIKIKYLAKKY